ncbi:MAG: MerR family transcriptional regulator, partial [Gemmatimonadetes bacterium]|nr:MerR family transcriptional regulator [Gemmatimonadota bacterium]
MSTTLSEAHEPKHPIRVVSERTGLSPDVLRAWEKRYRAVEPPRRTGGSQRLYSDADVDRLRMLRRVTQAGRSIGQVAELSTAELAALVREDEAALHTAPTPRPAGGSARTHVDRCLLHIRDLNSGALEAALMRALLALGAERFLDEVAVPVMREVGRAWEEKVLGIAQEHLATAVLRRVLGFAADAVEVAGQAPLVVVGTPARQAHEMGALLAAVSASVAGWRVTYLGPDLPAEEIAGAARKRGAQAVALSAVYPADDPELAGELRRLRSQLPPGVTVFVGGEGARAAVDALGPGEAGG